MRIVFTILFLYCFAANAETYYISSTGSNAANGTAEGTPWQTIAYAVGNMIGGDSLLFKKGDTWNEQLIPSASNQYFGSYGSGNKPLITGFKSVTGWTNDGNVWSATFSNSVPYQNTVMVNGAWVAKGRYPNTTYLTYTPLSKTKIIGHTLTGTPNYVGGEIAIAENNFLVDVSKITAQSVDTLTFANATFYGGVYNFRFTIQNIESVLDLPGEWCYDSTSKVLKVYATTQPTVQASSIDTIVKIYRKNYITLDGLNLTGGNSAMVYLDSAQHITIQNCAIQYGGTNGVWSYPRSDYTTIQNSSISDIWNTGIMNDGFADGITTNGGRNLYVYRNEVRRCGVKFGMGKSYFKAYIGIYSMGRNAVIQENTVDSTGYIGVQVMMDSFLVYRNTVSNMLLIKNDGAGIYSWANGQGFTSVGGRIKNNIVHSPSGTAIIYNIYLDEGCSYVDIDSNTIYNNTREGGILVHAVNRVRIRYNNIYGCVDGIVNGQSRQLNSYIVGNKIYNLTYTYNHYPLNFMVGYVDSLAVLGVIDSNYYSRPSNENDIIGYNGTQYELPDWRAFSGRDLNSGLTPTGITDAVALLKVNASTTPASQPLPGTYYDFTGRAYNNSITLRPYESAILFKAINDLPPDPNYTPVRKMKFKKIKL